MHCVLEISCGKQGAEAHFVISMGEIVSHFSSIACSGCRALELDWRDAEQKVCKLDIAFKLRAHYCYVTTKFSDVESTRFATRL